MDKMDGWIDLQILLQIGKWMVRGQVDGQMGRLMEDGQMDEQIGQVMEGWVDGYIDGSIGGSRVDIGLNLKIGGWMNRCDVMYGLDGCG